MVENIKSMKIWSIFKYKPDGPKMPCWADTGRWGLEWKDPANLVTYGKAIMARQMHKADGLGIIIPPGYFAIDLDGVVSSEGAIEDRALDLIEALDSYTERSPSGKGIHILVMGRVDQVDGAVKNITITSESGLEIEIKAPGTYLTFTGDVFHDAKIRDRTELIRATYDKYLEDHPAKKPVATTTSINPGKYHKCAYGEAALKAECERIRSTPKGSRTYTLHGRSKAIGELIPEGHVSEDGAAQELMAAGVASGLNKSKVEVEVYKGLQLGKSDPRHVECKAKAPRLDLSGIFR